MASREQIAGQSGIGPVPGQAAAVIELDDVTKTFNSTTVIDGITARFHSGQIYGLIGPSGCGKTTLIRMLIGVVNPSSGRIRVIGADPARFGAAQRQRIGYMPQGFFLYPSLTVQQNTRFVAGLYGVGWLARRNRIRQLLEMLELWDVRSRLASELSGGMRRRLSLACALIHSPDMLFVDEPTVGLDPVLRAKIWNYLHGLRDSGITIILTTQYIDEAAYCDQVGLVRAGRLIAAGSPQELRRQAILEEALDIEIEHLSAEDIGALVDLPAVISAHWLEDGLFRLMVQDAGPATIEISRALQERGLPVRAIRPSIPTFDDIFMKLVSDHD